MKLIRLATVAALSTTILAGGVNAFAEEARNVTTDGEATFRAYDPEGGGDGGETEVIPPVEPEEGGPDVEIKPEVPGSTGPLTIAKAAHMNFGEQIISNQDQTYDMLAEFQPLADGTDEVPYVSFAQVQDTRGTNAGWNLQVSMTEFTSNTQNNVLEGAQLTFYNPSIKYGGNNAANTPSIHMDGAELIPGTGSLNVMTAKDGQGAGTSSVIWGNQEDLNAQWEEAGGQEDAIITNDAIQLYIPGSTAKDATTYRSTLSWELTTTPGTDAGETDPEETPEA